MTIGIGAVGTEAGLAVWKGLNRVEQVCEGSIRGFATFAIITGDGTAKHFGTQRGGSQTLFTEGEDILERPPDDVAEASIAGVISSGPDRPEPLSQFLPAKDDVGLVTGHRIPNAPGDNGEPLNKQVLQRMEEGMAAEEAVEDVLTAHPNADTGLIAVDVDGNIGAMHTEKVANRPDIAHQAMSENGATVQVIHNQIDPADLAARIASTIALDMMTTEDEPDIQIRLDNGLKVEHGEEDRAYVNKDNVVTRVVTTDATLLEGERVGVAPYFLSPIIKDGEEIGKVVDEMATVFEDGEIQSLSGKSSAMLDVRTYE